MKSLRSYYNLRNLTRSFSVGIGACFLLAALGVSNVLIVVGVLVFLTLAGPAIAAKEDVVRK
mgnify:CR=1 FL=1